MGNNHSNACVQSRRSRGGGRSQSLHLGEPLDADGELHQVGEGSSHKVRKSKTVIGHKKGERFSIVKCPVCVRQFERNAFEEHFDKCFELGPVDVRRYERYVLGEDLENSEECQICLGNFSKGTYL
eukprot:Nk52_evm26s208 gene=Nk52_evmTU26s208